MKYLNKEEKEILRVYLGNSKDRGYITFYILLCNTSKVLCGKLPSTVIKRYNVITRYNRILTNRKNNQ